MDYSGLREKLERFFITGYPNAYISGGGIISIRYKITDFTKTPTKYFNLIRKMMPLFNVVVIRNEHAIQEGIYIIGRQQLADKFESVLKEIIYDTEEQTVKWSHSKNSPTEIHGHTQKSKYRVRIIFKLESLIEGIKKDYDQYAEMRHILEREKMDQVSFMEYIKGYSHLRSKTPLRGYTGWEEEDKD